VGFGWLGLELPGVQSWLQKPLCLCSGFAVSLGACLDLSSPVGDVDSF
jgi:hypothetical protein